MEPHAPAIERETPEECSVGDWVVVRTNTGPSFRGATANGEGHLVTPCGKTFGPARKDPEDGKHSSRWVRYS
jgi:hypothetical protein